jgi:tetratricopeptide (TPR) repeat protein
MKPGVFHLNNLLLHMLCTLLVFVLLKRLGANLFISVAVTLLFAVHPMRVESVAWVTERKDVLYGFFYLLALIFYLNFYKTRKILFYFLALAAFIFALFSKIQAVSLPLILILVDYFFEKKFTFRQLKDKIPFFILSLATGLAGIYFLGNQGTLDAGRSFPIIQRVFIGTYTFCVYVVKSVVPYQLSAVYPYPDKLSLLHYASVIPVILIAILIYRSARHRTELVFGSLFFLFNVVFMLQIVGAGQAYLADRFTYLAYIGLFFLIAWGLNFLVTSKWKIHAIILGLMYLVVLGTVTFERTRIWKNSKTLFSDVIKKYPDYALAYTNLGFYYSDQNQMDKAIAAYTRSIGLDPAQHVTYSNRGEALFNRGEIDKALQDMNMAIKLKPDYVKALSNRGAIWGAKKEYQKALADLDRAIALDPRNLSAYSNRILVNYTLGNYEKTIQDVNAYLEIKPGDADMVNVRGLCYGGLNRDREALDDFNRSIQLNPNAGAYYQNRSSLLYKTGDRRGALQDALRAQQLGLKVDPRYLKILQNN